MAALLTGSTSSDVFQLRRLQQVLVGRYIQVSACLFASPSLCLLASLSSSFAVLYFAVIFSVVCFLSFCSGNFLEYIYCYFVRFYGVKPGGRAEIAWTM